MKYQIAVVVTIEADSYDEAWHNVENIVEGVPWGKAPGAPEVEVIDYYEHDNEHNRALYLHPENSPYPSDDNDD